jgi:hypothetical protein
VPNATQRESVVASTNYRARIARRRSAPSIAVRCLLQIMRQRPASSYRSFGIVPMVPSSCSRYGNHTTGVRSPGLPFVHFAFVTKGEANEGFRTVRRDCRGCAGRGLQRSPKHVVSDAAELVEHVAIESIEPVVAVVRDGFLRSIESVVESIGRRIVELIESRQIVCQLEHAAVEQSIRQGQGQEQVIVGPCLGRSAQNALIAPNEVSCVVAASA